MSNSSIGPIDRTLSGATTLGQSGPGSNGNEEVFHIPEAVALLEPQHQMVLCHIQDTLREGRGLIFLQRYSQCISQSQLTGLNYFVEGHHRKVPDTKTILLKVGNFRDWFNFKREISIQTQENITEVNFRIRFQE